MFLKLLALSVIWLEVNFVSGQQPDIYELEYWTRAPKYGIYRRKQDFKPRFRNTSIANRLKRPLREKSEEHKSTKHSPGDKEEEKDHVTKPPKIKHSNEEEGEDDKTATEYISAYSLKQDMEKLSCKLEKESNITVEVIGRTFEYNDIVILKMAERSGVISKYFRANEDKYIDDVPEKKILFIVHALTTKGIKDLPCLNSRKSFLQLLNYYMEHLDKFDIYLVPFANPDGYMETFEDEHWVKNVGPQDPCRGVALDRNFDVAWGSGSSVGPCSQNYPGPTAFSEPESKAIRDVFHRYGHKIVAYIHVHAGSIIQKTFKGEAVLYPKGYTEATSDDDKYMDMKGEIDETMRNASFQRMSVTMDTLYHWYGKVTGTSVDYASTVFGIPYALEFVMETYEAPEFQNAALSAVWKRVIDAVFNFIHKKGDMTEAVNK